MFRYTFVQAKHFYREMLGRYFIIASTATLEQCKSTLKSIDELVSFGNKKMQGLRFRFRADCQPGQLQEDELLIFILQYEGLGKTIRLVMVISNIAPVLE
jgi:hypothetical protein